MGVVAEIPKVDLREPFDDARYVDHRGPHASREPDPLAHHEGAPGQEALEELAVQGLVDREPRVADRREVLRDPYAPEPLEGRLDRDRRLVRRGFLA